MKELHKQNFNKYSSKYKFEQWENNKSFNKKFLFDRIFDADKNGAISRDELLQIVQHLFHLIPEKHKENLPTPQKVSTLIVQT